MTPSPDLPDLLGPRERARLDQLDAEGLATLLTVLETERRWPAA